MNRQRRTKEKNPKQTRVQAGPPEKAKPWVTMGRKATDPEIASAISARSSKLKRISLKMQQQGNGRNA
jgi:hypothetical protein